MPHTVCGIHCKIWAIYQLKMMTIDVLRTNDCGHRWRRCVGRHFLGARAFYFVMNSKVLFLSSLYGDIWEPVFVILWKITTSSNLNREFQIFIWYLSDIVAANRRWTTPLMFISTMTCQPCINTIDTG